MSSWLENEPLATKSEISPIVCVLERRKVRALQLGR